MVLKEGQFLRGSSFVWRYDLDVRKKNLKREVAGGLGGEVE